MAQEINYSYSIEELVLNEIERMINDGTQSPGHWTYSFDKESGDVELRKIKDSLYNSLTEETS